MPELNVSRIRIPNGDYLNIKDYRSSDINAAIEAILGGGSATKSDVNFYDYDGTIVNSYSTAEFAQLSAMPANPSHTGLTAQGWNWSLSDAKTYVASYGKLDIGQMYVTSDGKTRFYITLTEGRISPIMKLTLDSNSEVDIDWGDGTTHDTLSGSGDMTTNRHAYASAGSYVITITVSGGGITIPHYILNDGNSSINSPDIAYLNAIKKVEIGNRVGTFDSQAFGDCHSLLSITIPNSVTSIGNYAFQSCSSLSSITIPSSIISISSYIFQNCQFLSSIIIPNSVTSINDYAFYICSSLQSITIPSSVTSIGTNVFNSCTSLSSITIPSSVTSIGTNAFRYCSALSSVTIPNSIMSIGSEAFQNCSSLPSITIPSSVTSIGNYTFQNCYSLSSIVINKSEGSITGSPWSATTGSPTYTQTIWRTERYKSSVTEISAGTTLTGTIDATEDDLVVATFVIRGNTYTISEGWTLLGISNPIGTSNQRTAMAYKIASSSSESLIVTQDTSARIYINLISITGASIGSFSGFTTQGEGNTIAMNKPQGLVIWGVSSSQWGTSSPYSLWGVSPVSNNRTSIQLPISTQPRCLTVLDQSNDETVSFTYSPGISGNGALAAASLTVTEIPNFWYF